MTTWKRTKPKWPASLGLLFVMALGMLLLSEVQVKAAADKVLYIVDSSGTNKTVTADDNGTGWSYAADTATLTLDGFDGSYIESDGDLKVVLKGTNRLTPDNDKDGVIIARSGKITIDKSDNDETDQLVIENAAITHSSYTAFLPGSRDADALLIQGGTVKVNLTDTNTSCSSLSVADFVTVKGDANLDVTLKSSAYYMGIYIRLYVKENADVSIKGYRTKGTPGSALATLTAKDTTGRIYMESMTDSGYGVAFCAETGESIQPAAGGVITAKGMVAQFDDSSCLGKTVKAEPAERMQKVNSSVHSRYFIHSDADGNPISESTFTGTDEVQPFGFMGEKFFDIPAATVGKVVENICLYGGVYGNSSAYFKIVNGTLPEGITLNGGKIGGTPTAECAAGSVTIEARRYSNEADNTDNDRVTFTISYGAVTEAPKYLTIGTVKYDKAGDSSGTGWSYAADTATLTLDGFDGSYIESDGDLKVVLKGTNRLTPDNDKDGVIIARSGKITIDKSDNDETDQLVIENAAITHSSYTAFLPGSRDADALLIQGGTVKVNLTDTNTSCSSLSVADFVTVKGDANLDVTLKSSAYYMGIYIRLYVKENADVSIKGYRTKGTPGSALATLTAKDTTGRIYMESMTDSGYGVAFCAETGESIQPAAGGVITAKGMVAQFDDSSCLGKTVKAEPAERMQKVNSSVHSRYFIHSDADGNPISESTFTGTDEVQPFGFMGEKFFDIPAATVGKVVENICLYGGVYGNSSAYFKIVNGTLPEGITLNGGKIGGTPTAECAAGSVTIEARRYSNEADNTDNDRTTFTINYGAVTVSSPVTGVTLDQGEMILDVNQEGALNAIVQPEDATISTVTWKSADESVARVDSTGKVKAVAPGKTTVTATTTQGAKTASAVIYVKEKMPEAGINYRNEMLTGLKSGASYIVSGSGITTETFTASGITTPVKEEWMGNTITLVCNNTEDKCSSDPQTIVIPERPDAPVGINAVNESYAGAGDGKITGVDSTMMWRRPEGVWLVCTGEEITGLGAGSYQISYMGSDAMFASKAAEVTVGMEGLKFIYRTEFDIPEGAAGTDIALVDVSGAATGGKKPYIFSKVSGPEWLIVSGDGRITGTRPGTTAGADMATIRVTDSDGAAEDITLVVGAVIDAVVIIPATNISLNKNEVTIYTGGGETLIATVEPADTTDSISWESDNTGVATVDDTGRITAVAAGVANITVKAGSRSASCVVTVENSSCTHTDKSVVPEKASTCKEKGWNAYEMCNTCGMIFTGDGQIPYRELADHTGGTATCTQKAVCTECGQPYGNYLDHSYTAETKNEETMKTAGTCKEEAVYYYSYSMCGKIEYEDSHTFYGDRDASKHTGGTEVRNLAEATCSEKGYTGDTYCRGCNKLLETGEELAALGHDYLANVTKQSTTTEEGIRTYTCTRCGHSYTESIAKLTSPSPQPTATPSGKPETPSPQPTATPSDKPETPSPQPTATPSDKPETPSPQPKGTNLKDDTGAAYKVTSANGKTPAVQYLAPKSGTKGTVTVPSEVTIDGVTYKVTSIAGNAFKGTKKIKKIVIGSNITSIGKNAFAGCTSLTSITIGKNVKKIGKNAFTGCKKLKSIIIKTKKLTTKTVKKGAFNGISKKVVVKVPKSKYKTYKKLLPAKGLKKAVKIKK